MVKVFMLCMVVGLYLIGMVGVFVTATEIKKVREIDQKELCLKEVEMGIKEKKCKGNEDKIKLKDDGLLQIELNEGVYKVWSKG